MKKKIILFIFIISAVFTQAQKTAFYENYSWEENPRHSDFKVETEESLIFLKEKWVNEFAFIGDGLVEFALEHKIIWLNSDDAIESYNKVYLPYSSNSELLINKARVLLKGNKVVELDSSKILTAKDEETNRTYKYFAFEGVEKGSFIEYYYVVKRYPRYKGSKKSFQNEYVKRNVEFDLYAPSNLVFEFKSYNGLPEVQKDTLSKEKLHWNLKVDSIGKLEKEEQSSYHAEKQFLIYKLDKNTYNNTTGISSYKNTSKNLYSYLFKELSKKEKSAIKKVIKASGISKEKTDELKIRRFENYIKNNFYISKLGSDELSDIVSVVKTKSANDDGLMQLYIAALQYVGIQSQVVVTSDRFQIKFDSKFEANNFLTDYLLYFPSVKKYTSVESLDARLGYAPPELTDNYGLFIKEVALGGYKNGVGKIRYIQAPSDIENSNNMNIEVVFDEDDLTLTKINTEHSYGGYTARFIQPYLKIAAPDKLDELYDSMIKFMGENITIKEKNILNDDSDLYGVKPLIINSKVESNAFVDKAGRNYLFKVGELIGPQSEMYQEKERVMPIEVDYNRFYDREIKVEIPEGYTIKGLEALNIHEFYKEKDQNIFEFKSSYILEDSLLKIKIIEYYRQNRVSNSVYQDYRKVINSAADFNKIILILEKTN